MLTRGTFLGLVGLVMGLGLSGPVAVADSLLQEILVREHVLKSTLSVRHWNIEEDNGKSMTISEYSLPLLSYVLPSMSDPLFIGDLMVDVVSGYVYSTWRVNQRGLELGGFTDTKIRAIYAWWEDRFMLRAGISVPSGQTQISQEDAPLIDDLNESALGFNVKQLGKGSDVDIGGGFTQEVETGWGRFVIGVGGSYLFKDDYKPFENIEYRPGDEIRGVVGIDFDHKRHLIRLDAVYTDYGELRADQGRFKTEAVKYAELTWRLPTVPTIWKWQTTFLSTWTKLNLYFSPQLFGPQAVTSVV